MVDFGPDPHRFASGFWGPGEDTGVIHMDDIDGGNDVNRFHFPARGVPSALLVAARLGSLAPGASTRVIEWQSQISVHAFWFSATRSSGAGTSVTLRFAITDGSSTSQSGVLTLPWRGADHLYAWAIRMNTDHPTPTGVVYGSSICDEVASATFNGSGSNTFILCAGGFAGAEGPSHTKNEPGVVTATAPSDLRVEYVASWWRITADEAPDADQIANRLLWLTCTNGWLIGEVGIG